MTLGDAMANQTAWLNVWLPILMFGSFILPLALLVWKSSRMAGLAAIAAGLLSFVDRRLGARGRRAQARRHRQL